MTDQETVVVAHGRPDLAGLIPHILREVPQYEVVVVSHGCADPLRIPFGVSPERATQMMRDRLHEWDGGVVLAAYTDSERPLGLVVAVALMLHLRLSLDGEMDFLDGFIVQDGMVYGMPGTTDLEPQPVKTDALPPRYVLDERSYRLEQTREVTDLGEALRKAREAWTQNDEMSAWLYLDRAKVLNGNVMPREGVELTDLIRKHG